MRNRAYLLVALLGLLTFALPGFAAAGQGKNLSEIALASGAAARAAAVSGPVISVSPLGHDYGIVNVGSSSSFMFTVSNTGDAALHISGAATSGSFSASFGSTTVAAGGSTSMTVVYAPSSGVDEASMVTVNSDATNGAFSVNVSGRGNAAPVLDPIGNKSANAFVNLHFVTTSSDNGDQIDDVLGYSVSPALPPGATYNTTTGDFNWTPQPSDAGSYTLTFCVTDGYADDCETITITVTAGNNPPVAAAGGPYSGATNQPIQFNGSGSSDPDGNGLSYAWDFGDGGTGSGVSPSHTYIAANNYLVTLTVTDDGSPSLSDQDVASVQVVNSINGSIAFKMHGTVLRITGGGKVAMGMEINGRPPTDIDPNTITVTTTYPNSGTISSIAVDPKTASLGDLDTDGFADLDVTVPRTQLKALLSNVPNGATVTLVMNARTTAGTGNLPVRVTGNVTIKGGAASSVSAFASPNPFNPETAISLTLKNNGPVSVRIYSIEGRLVKTLKDEFATAGTHEVRWNGKDSAGRPVPSGMYFVKTEQGADKSVFKLSLLK
jgi:PKD repeat protein